MAPLIYPSALDNGADRLEVCGPLAYGGGTSPSFALVRQIRAAYPRSSLMVRTLSPTRSNHTQRFICRPSFTCAQVMARPRAGDFAYSPSELDLMADEIDLLKTIEPPIDGVVLGCLQADSSIDVDATRR